MRPWHLALGVLLLLLCAALPAAGQMFVAQLNGASEVPPSGSLAGGVAFFVYDSGSGFLEYSITCSGLGTVTEAHLHGPGGPGTNAPLQFTLPADSLSQGIVGPLGPAQASALLGETWYVNVHTLAYPTGEIRGQLQHADAVQPRTWSALKSLYAR